jgi:putative ABC transport system permease protein
MRLFLLQGRDFTIRDDARSARVAIVNQTMARRYWPDEDAVGKRIRFGGEDLVTIVGVARDAEQRDWGAAAENEFYFPWAQDPVAIQRYVTLVARTAGDPLALAGSIRERVWAVDRDLMIGDVLSMQQVVDRAVWQPRFSTTLLGGFAAMALGLAAIGIYGVISFDVSRRTREIGIRMALGARPGNVLRAVLAGGIKLTAIGTAIGVAGALALTRYLETLLYEVSPTDPAVMTAAAAVLMAVTLAAVWLPARRATRVDPAVALRSE